MSPNENNRRLMRFPGFLVVAAVLAGSAAAAPVAAQTDGSRWAILVLAPDAADVEHGRDAAELAGGALAASGEEIVAMDAARFTLDEQIGSPPRVAPATLVARIDQALTDAVRAVANGRHAEAIAIGEPVLTESEPFATALGRADDAATKLANLCLVVARAHLEEGDESSARAQAAACVRLVPDVDPSPRVHPPEIRALVGSVRTRLATSDGANLSVEADGADATGCQVRLNGRPMGRAPWTSEGLVPGGYQVQLECDERAGRVRRVDLRAGSAVHLRLTPRLSSALDTRSGAPALVYAAAAEPEGDVVREDLATLARALEVARVLAIVATDHGIMLRAYAVDGTERVARAIGTAIVPEPVSEAASREAIASVVSGAGGTEAEQEPSPAPAPAATDDLLVPVIGGVVAALGLGTLGASWYLWTEVDARGQALNRVGTASQIAPAQRAFDDAAVLVPITGAIGSLALTISLPMFLPDAGREVPWWSLVIGAAGLGVLVVGIYFAASEGACYGSALAPCTRRSPTWSVGTLILEHAAPLLAVPLTYLVRAFLPASSGASASLRIEADGGELSVGASF